MAMYVWDRFTMSLVLMYSRPTCAQTDRGMLGARGLSRQQGAPLRCADPLAATARAGAVGRAR